MAGLDQLDPAIRVAETHPRESVDHRIKPGDDVYE